MNIWRSQNRKRLPTGDTNEFDEITVKLHDFISNGNVSNDIVGVFEFKRISEEDRKLELIPENYLDSPILTDRQVTEKMKKVFADMTFQGIKDSL